MPQMFDWIFFAIMLPVPALLYWEWRTDALSRFTASLK
jgi:hypothetical protein